MLEQLMPREVFYYFEQLCQIPHGSGNIEQISDYLVSFAKERGLFYIQDEMKNVIIVKEATPGYEMEPPMIIQGHMDMVAVKEEGCPIDMQTEGLQLAVDGNYIYAEGTSLGADDGVAVAFALAVLDSDTLSHPRLEVVITVDEEVGMDGALAIDLSMLKGKRLLNIDSEKQGELTVSCAGGVRVNGKMPYETSVQEKDESKTICTLKLTGLTGGHSGTEIHHNRANSNVELAKLLQNINKTISFELISINGGLKDNAIPIETVACLVLDNKDKGNFEAEVSRLEGELAGKFAATDAELRVCASYEAMDKDTFVINKKDAEKIIELIATLPNGVQAMSRELEGLVETSLNLGIITTLPKEIQLATALRSSKKDSKESLCKKVVGQIERAGGEIALSGDYPAWEYKNDSKLIGQMSRIYEEMFRESPKVLAIHAGLECGILADKIPGLDSVSFGPDILDIHTTNEKLSISSTEQMWSFLVAILKEKVREV